MRRLRSFMLSLTGTAGLLTGAAGCLPGSKPLPATIEVRDADTRAPVEAVVMSRGGNVFLPPSDVLAPPLVELATPAGDRVRTGADGRANLTLAGSRPNEVIIFAEGYPPLHLLIEAGPTTASGALDWSTGLCIPGGPARDESGTLEARVRTR